MAEWTKATVLKTVMLRAPVNKFLNPKKEAPSNEGAFLVSATPHTEKAPRVPCSSSIPTGSLPPAHSCKHASKIGNLPGMLG